MKKLIVVIGISCCYMYARQVPKSIEGQARADLTHSFQQKEAEEIFTDIYRTNFWHGWESISGQGSNISTTRTIRTLLPELMKKLHIKTLVDAPCGDFHWMKEAVDQFGLDLYIGLDIVKPLVYRCQQQYGSSRTVFLYADLITCPIPKSDMIFSRDCLAHLSYKDAYQVIKNFKESGSIYLLTSHHVHTQKNMNIVNGNHYAINLTIAPFNFPHPQYVIQEKDVEPASAHQGKCLALWCLDDIDLNDIQV